jgi:hypothetical protein
LKYPSQKKAGGVAQNVGCEFKSQYHKKKKNEGLWKRGGEGYTSVSVYLVLLN